MSEVCDIAVIGAGAAGLAAGIAAAESARHGGRPLRVVLLDAAKRIGAKILIAGGGRCNVTHERVGPDDYHGPRQPIRNILAGFDQQATVRWFEALGVPLRREPTGKLFPVSDSARTVLDALDRRCGELGVTILPDHRVQQIIPQTLGPLSTGASFLCHHDRGQLRASRVILCTGGRAGSSAGSGQGYDLARALGHTVTDLQPALVPLNLAEGFFHAQLAGLTHEVQLAVFVDGRQVDRRTGSLLWTHTGISGPVVLDVSRHWTTARAAGRAVELRCGLLPGETFEAVEQWLTCQATDSPHRQVDTVLATRLPRRLVDMLLGRCRIPPQTPAGQLRRELRRDLVHALVELPLPVISHRGWQTAEVTAGGVPLQEIDYRTMESRKTPGLCLAGELLDCDGRLGGFNLQWAWSTGHLAGRAAAAALNANPPRA